MHVRSSLFVNPRIIAAAKLAAGAAACGLLSGCLTAPFHDAKVDPRSPIAAEVPKQVRADAPYPTFAAFPKKPADIRPHAQYGKDARAVEAQGQALVKATADDTWTLTNPEDFADKARSDAGPALPAAPAADQKARAKTPPPVTP